MDSFFWNVPIFRSSRSPIFFKAHILKNLASSTGKHLCWSLFLIKLLALKPATLIKRDSSTISLKLAEFFYEQLLLKNTSSGCFCCFCSTTNNVTLSVITITLSYNKKSSWRYCNYHHPSLYKNIHLLSKTRPSNSNIL